MRPNAVISIYGDDQISRSNPKLAAAVSEGLTLVRIIPIIWLYNHETKSDNLIIDTLSVKNKIILKYWSMHLHKYIIERKLITYYKEIDKC